MRRNETGLIADIVENYVQYDHNYQKPDTIKLGREVQR